MHYEFQPGVASIFVELLLPKRTYFQGRLYETLKRGFDTQAVNKHFRSPEKKAQILRLLRGYSLNARVTKQFMEGTLPEIFSPILKGYSMYEVDGVFWDDKKNRCIEERTQVIRIILVPEIDEWYAQRIAGLTSFPLTFPEVRSITRRHIANNTPSYILTTEYIQRLIETDVHVFRERAWDPSDPALKNGISELCEYLDNWVDYAALFIFGFVVFSICEEIETLSEAEPDFREQVIWVTSIWPSLVNRVIDRKPASAPSAG